MGYVGPFPLKVQDGGTGEITLAQNAVLVGENTTDIGVTNVGTNGQLLIAATSNKPQFASLASSGGTITFTSGANSLNLEVSGTGSSSTLIFQARTSSGSVTKGQLVYVNGFDGGLSLPLVRLADASGSTPGNWPAIGMVLTNFDASTTGTVQVFGRINGVDTTAFSAGATLYLSTSSGAYTNTKPTGANAIQAIGTVLQGGTASGSIFLDIPADALRVPNIPNDQVWVGSNSGIATPTSLANGILTYDTSGNAFSGSTVTQNGLVYGGASNTVTSLAVATNGQIPIGSTGAAPVLATITAGNGISITNGAGSISVATSAFSSINVQTFTASGTYTPTSGMKYCTIEVVGGGGGGGGCESVFGTNSIGGAGGAGGYARKTVSAATIGASKSVTVGAGGAGGAAGNNAGASGGTSSVGSVIVQATGGAGGSGGPSSVIVTNASGLGGVGSGGDINANGQPGGTLLGYNAGGIAFLFAPSGGSSIFGGGALGFALSGNAGSDGSNATAYGSGGGGAAALNAAGPNAGGNGSDGIVIITEYI